MLNEKDTEFLKNTLPVWDKLDYDEQNLIVQNTVPVIYQCGENINSSAEDCVGVLLIKSGKIRVYILSEDGREITLYRLSHGDVCILSASCILKNISFDVHINAESDTRVLLISSSFFKKLTQKNIYAENFSNKIAVDRFSDVMWTMEQILFMSFDRRLALFLIEESANQNSDTIHLTHEQIAKYVGSAREVVSRMLKYFAGEGWVELTRGSVKILNKTAMQKLAS